MQFLGVRLKIDPEQKMIKKNKNPWTECIPPAIGDIPQALVSSRLGTFKLSNISNDGYGVNFLVFELGYQTPLYIVKLLSSHGYRYPIHW